MEQWLINMKKLRIIIDIIMFILIIILMGYHITDNKIHEYIGITTFVLFIIHHIINYRYYKNLFKGKYNFGRIFSLVIDALLLIAMLGTMISSIMISSEVFAFLNITTTNIGRRLHLIATSWCFILMAIHIGMHLNAFVYKMKNKLKNSNFEYAVYVILILVIIYGIYAFIKHRLWQDMLLLVDFKFFDYNQSPIMFYLEYLGIVIFIASFTCLITKLINKKK